ncbi:MAG: thioesterase family protein [Hyphomonadaceae bacterium]
MADSPSESLIYSDLMASLSLGVDGKYKVHIPGNWLQGRTTYGGLSAALCYEAGKSLRRDMALRSAQIAFIGPAGGDVWMTAETLRAGKSSTYVGVDLYGEKGLATRAIFVFGSARPTGLQIAPQLVAPERPAPNEQNSMFPENVGPSFIGNFQVELVAGGIPMSGAETTENMYWLRHRDAAAPSDITALLALTDAPPPVALSLCSSPVRISSMNWSIDVLTDVFETKDNWWLSKARAETIKDGYSSQSMTLWDHAGRPVLASRQTIAIFG